MNGTIKKSPLYSSPPLVNFLLQVERNDCIICLEPNNLIKNERCTCIYYYHQGCLNNTANPNQCLLCKKIVGNTNNLEITSNTHNTFNNICIAVCILIILVLILLFIFYAGGSGE